jgi:hypothetical protein
MVRVYLEAKIESPITNSKIEDIISIEINKKLEAFSNSLAADVAELIKKHNEIKVHSA